MTTGRINQVAFLNNTTVAQSHPHRPPLPLKIGEKSAEKHLMQQLRLYKTHEAGQMGTRGPVP